MNTAVDQLLDLSIKTKTLITQTDENLRGQGKTLALIKKANELDVTLLVGTRQHKSYIDELSTSLGIEVDCQHHSDITK